MPYANLFVAKLPRKVADKDLEEIFAEYSPISTKVMLDPSTGKSKGFGFVLFKTEMEGKRAHDALNNKTVRTGRHDFVLTICPSEHSGTTAISPSTALYIRNIPIVVTQKQVEEFLATFGTLLYCAMREDHHGNPVWVVYAEYDCLECSGAALKELHGNSRHFGGPPVMVKYADSKEAKVERRRRREEGKIVPTNVTRSVCVFPPPPPPHLLLSRCRGESHVRHTQREHHGAPLEFFTSARTCSGDNDGSRSGSVCFNETAFSRDLTACSVGPIHNSDSSSSTSSVYKVVDNVFAPPSASIPPKYPLLTQNFSLMQPVENNSNVLPAMFLLDKGQQFVLASNAVNVSAANFATMPRSVFVQLPLGTMHTTIPPGLFF